ncbi:Non-LTR Zorro retrotransposon orf1-like protein, putative, partial [Candida maltosa Xu316]
MWINEISRHYTADAKFIRHSIKAIIQNTDKITHNIAIFRINSKVTSPSAIDCFFKFVPPKSPDDDNHQNRVQDIPFNILGESHQKNMTYFLIKFPKNRIPTVTTKTNPRRRFKLMTHLLHCNICHTTDHARSECVYKWKHPKSKKESNDSENNTPPEKSKVAKSDIPEIKQPTFRLEGLIP